MVCRNEGLKASKAHLLPVTKRRMEKMGNGDELAQVKGMIVEHARKGAFDSSPLIRTAHPVPCPSCKGTQSVVLLEYLKTGDFEIGKAEQVDVFITEGIINFLEHETHTPIVVRPVCKGCGSPLEVKLVNVEYLQVIIDRPTSSNTMYA